MMKAVFFYYVKDCKKPQVLSSEWLMVNTKVIKVAAAS